MRLYRSLWLVLSCAAVLVGGVVGVLHLNTAGVVALVAAAIFGILVTAIARTPPPSDRHPEAVPIGVGLLAAGTYLVHAGLMAILGHGMAWWTVVSLVLTAPPLLTAASRMLHQRTYRESKIAGGGVRAGTSPPVRDPHQLDDRQLCEAWCATAAALRQEQQRRNLRGQLRLWATRSALLDELECRDEPGFRRWLYAPGGPSSDPRQHSNLH